MPYLYNIASTFIVQEKMYLLFLSRHPSYCRWCEGDVSNERPNIHIVELEHIRCFEWAKDTHFERRSSRTVAGRLRFQRGS